MISVTHIVFFPVFDYTFPLFFENVLSSFWLFSKKNSKFCNDGSSLIIHSYLPKLNTWLCYFESWGKGEGLEIRNMSPSYASQSLTHNPYSHSERKYRKRSVKSTNSLSENHHTSHLPRSFCSFLDFLRQYIVFALSAYIFAL